MGQNKCGCLVVSVYMFFCIAFVCICILCSTVTAQLLWQHSFRTAPSYNLCVPHFCVQSTQMANDLWSGSKSCDQWNETKMATNGRISFPIYYFRRFSYKHSVPLTVCIFPQLLTLSFPCPPSPPSHSDSLYPLGKSRSHLSPITPSRCYFAFPFT